VRERETNTKLIEADAGPDTKTTTKIWKMKNKMKEKKAIETYTWLGGPRRRNSRISSKPSPQPQPQLEHPRTTR
jgi:hypothetical protein